MITKETGYGENTTQFMILLTYSAILTWLASVLLKKVVERLRSIVGISSVLLPLLPLARGVLDLYKNNSTQKEKFRC